MFNVCTSCGAKAPPIVCTSCGKLQPCGHDLCYFQMLAIEKTMSVDLKTLEHLYLEKQKKVHPDNFINATSREKLYAAQWSQTLNQAYATLKDPIETGFYILRSIPGGKAVADQEIIHDPNLLIYVYEQQEEIDGCHNTSSLEEMYKAYDEKLSSLVELINQSLQKCELEKAFQNLNTALYLKKLQESAKEKVEKIKGLL